MRNMALLIDTNVILNYITNRDDPYLEQSVEVVRCCDVQGISLFTHFQHSGM